MGYRDSGVMACDTFAQAVERYARLAHHLAKLDPDEPQGPAAVVLCLVSAKVLRFVDLGLPPGRAEVTFGRLANDPDGAEWPLRVQMLQRQSPEKLRLACAHACAQIVAWTRNEVWPEGTMTAVAHAILLPAARILAGRSHDVEDLASIFTVDVDVVRERLRVLRAKSGSGERRAIPGI